MKRKKIEFGDLKSGQYFRYKRKLYIKDSEGETAVHLASGCVELFADHSMVTPVKVEFRVKG